MTTRKKKTGTSWKKVGVMLVTLTAAVNLFQQAERALITTVQDVASFSYGEPVTYDGLERIRVDAKWGTPIDPSLLKPIDPLQ
jgi:hypothetical protein